MIQTQKKSRQRPQQSLLGEIARYKLPIPRVTFVYYYETSCLYLCVDPRITDSHSLWSAAVRKTQTLYVTLVKPEGNTSERRQQGRAARALVLQFGGPEFEL